MPFLHRRLVCGACIALLLVSGGCGGSDLPPTYPVAGTVSFQDDQPVRGGLVRLITRDDPTLQIVGMIERDGTFRLQTFRGNAKAEGAPPGEYEVSVQPPLGQPADPVKQPQMASSHLLSRKVKVEASDDNVFELVLPFPSPQQRSRK